MILQDKWACIIDSILLIRHGEQRPGSADRLRGCGLRCSSTTCSPTSTLPPCRVWNQPHSNRAELILGVSNVRSRFDANGNPSICKIKHAWGPPQFVACVMTDADTVAWQDWPP